MISILLTFVEVCFIVYGLFWNIFCAVWKEYLFCCWLDFINVNWTWLTDSVVFSMLACFLSLELLKELRFPSLIVDLSISFNFISFCFTYFAGFWYIFRICVQNMYVCYVFLVDWLFYHCIMSVCPWSSSLLWSLYLINIATPAFSD